MEAAGRLFGRFLREQDGQDLVEYALLTSAIGIVGVALFPSIQTRMTTLFANWGTQVHNIWIPDDPQ
jgi:Flp pilus assembly pilin Flp